MGPEPKEQESKTTMVVYRIHADVREELGWRSGFAELLFAEECEETDADDELHDKRDPEPSCT